MRKQLKHAFIPHEGNDYKPGLFEYGAITSVLVVGIAFFMSSLAVNRFVVRTDQGAAVYASVLVDLTNKARSVHNQSDLTISETLTKAAQMKADDMASRQYFSHTSPDGTTPWYWFQKAGYNFVYAGENLAVDFTQSADVENAWLASPKHKENIIDPRFREIGIATKTASWQGRETTFVVQLFGTPASMVYESEEYGKTETSGSVLGTDTIKVASAAETVGAQQVADVHVVSETPSTIVAENSAVQSVNLGVETVSPKATPIEKAIVRIPSISNTALMALAGIVLAGLLLFVFVEIKRQHPKHVFLGIFAFVALVSLAYVSQSFALPI
jgi:hypothetical protein